MSLGPFPILLIPSTKNGKLQFWNDLTQQIIEADFSRPNTGATSGATVLRNGQLIELAEDDPDWDDADGCPVIKMRPQRTNLADYSKDLTNAAWSTKNDITITANSTTSPDGTVNADLITTGTANNDRLGRTIAISSDTFPISFYIKKGVNNDWVRVNILRGGFSNSAIVWVNINTGVIGQVSLFGTTTFADAKIKLDPISGFYRVSVVTTDATNNTSSIFYIDSALANANGNRVDNSQYYFWGFDPENEGKFSSGFIPTLTSPLARAANEILESDAVALGLVSTQGGFLVGSVILEIENYFSSNQSGNIILGFAVNQNSRAQAFGLAATNSDNYARFRYETTAGTHFDNSKVLTENKFKCVFSFDTNGLRIIFPDGIFPQSSVPVPDTFKILLARTERATYDIKTLSFSPIALTEAEALTALSSL
jgi:hypothetical protein